MNRVLMIALALLVSVSAHAGGNPDARVYIDFDPPNYVHSIPAPEQFTMLEAYLLVDGLGTGISVISFRFNDIAAEYPGFCAVPTFTDMFSDELPIWNPFEMGYTASSTQCRTDSLGPVLIGQISLFYIGSQGAGGCIKVVDHGEYPRRLGDCDDEVDYFCILSHGSVGGVECPTGDCGPVSVETGTWGSMKALYR